MNMTLEGSALKAARQAKGLSLDAVHEATKIPMDSLRAIEEGYTVRSLSPFYLKGFIKMYAEYLGIHVNDTAKAYQKEAAPPKAQPSAEGFDVEEWTARIFTSERKRQTVVVLGILLGLFLLFKAITFFTHKKPGALSASSLPVTSSKSLPETSGRKQNEAGAKIKVPSERKAAKEAEKEREDVVALPAIRIGEIKDSAKQIVGEKKSPKGVSERPPVLQDVPAQTVYTAGQPAAAPPPLQKEITLTVRAKKDSWLHVKSDGLVVFQSTLTRGAVETWIAHDKIEISGKNINQLEFELNGKILGALGSRDYRASKVLVTKDGLSVLQ